MRNVAKLLERKRTLLDRRHQAGSEHLAEVEHELHEIDEALSRLESMDAPPTVPQHPDRP
jgi:predicted CopG family antitoxin